MTTTRETTIDKLTEGDIVIAVAGRARPFPYVVTAVINQPTYGVTTVKYAHGGLIPPCDSKTTVTVAV
jgi:hypothetical protein